MAPGLAMSSVYASAPAATIMWLGAELPRPFDRLWFAVRPKRHTHRTEYAKVNLCPVIHSLRFAPCHKRAAELRRS